MRAGPRAAPPAWALPAVRRPARRYLPALCDTSTATVNNTQTATTTPIATDTATLTSTATSTDTTAPPPSATNTATDTTTVPLEKEDDSGCNLSTSSSAMPALGPLTVVLDGAYFAGLWNVHARSCANLVGKPTLIFWSMSPSDEIRWARIGQGL